MNPTVILFACANCDTKLTVPVSLGGMSDFCPLCQHKITSPTLEEYIEILKKEEAAKSSVADQPATPEEAKPTDPPEIQAKELDEEALTKSLQDVFKDHPPRPSKSPLETHAETSPEWSTSDLVDVFKHQPKTSEKNPSDPTTPEASVAPKPAKKSSPAPNELLLPLFEDSAESEASSTETPEKPAGPLESLQASTAPSLEPKATSNTPIASAPLEVSKETTPKSIPAERSTIAPNNPSSPKQNPSEVHPIATVTIPSNQALIDGASVHVDFSPPKSSPMTPPKAPLNELNLLSELTVPEFQQPIEKAPPSTAKAPASSKNEVADQTIIDFDAKPLASPNWDEPKSSAGKDSLPFLAGPKPKKVAKSSANSSTETVIKVTQKLNILPEGEQSISELLNLTPLEKKRPTPAASPSLKAQAPVPQPSSPSHTEESSTSVPQVIEKSSGRQWIEIPAVSTSSRRSKRFKRNLSIGVTCFLLVDLALVWLFQEPIKAKINWNSSPKEHAKTLSPQADKASPLEEAPISPLITNSPLLQDSPKIGVGNSSQGNEVLKAMPMPADSVAISSPDPKIETAKFTSQSNSSNSHLPTNAEDPKLESSKLSLPMESASSHPAPSDTSPTRHPVVRDGVSPESLPAFQVLESFLAADSWKARIPYIWKPEINSKKIEDYSKTAPSQPIQAAHIKLYSQNPSSETVPAHCIFGVQEVGSPRTIMVVVLFDTKSQAYKVDSQAFIEFRDDLLAAFCKTPGAPSQTFRVSVRRGHVVGEDSKIHASRVPFSITFPGSLERHTVFSSRGSEISRELVDALGWELEQTYMIQLKWQTTGDTAWIELEKIHSKTWSPMEP